MPACAIITTQAFSMLNFRGPLICDLVNAGVKVYALAPDYDAASRHKIHALGAVAIDFEMSRTGMNPMRDSLGVLKLAALLRKLQPDVTLGYFIKPVIYGTLAAWIARVPRRIAMIEGLGYVFTEPTGQRNWRRKLLKSLVSALYKLSLGLAHKVIFLNNDDLTEFVSTKIVRKEIAVNLGGIGVNLADWPVVPLHQEHVTFLLAARLLREKGITEYADAARQVKLQCPHARFILLGGLDPNPGALSQTDVQAWVSEGLLEWPGHVNVKPWLAEASVFVLPSYREGLPRSTQEAMAMGRPIITTDVPGCRDTVQQGVNGFLVPARDVSALAQAMLRFVRDPNLIESMGKESRRIAVERYDVHRVNARLMALMGLG